MELNVIDLSRDDSNAQRRVRAQRPDNRGADIKLAPRRDRGTGRNQEPVRRAKPGTYEGQGSVRRSRTYEEQAAVRRSRSYEEQTPVRRPRAYREQAPVRRPRSYGEQAPARRPQTADPRARQERLRRQKRRRRKQLAARLTVLIFLAGLIAVLIFVLARLITGKDEKEKEVQTFHNSVKQQEISKEDERTLKPPITENFLTVNEYSRPGEALESVKNIFVHYTANRGTSAAQNRSYFENLGITGETSASAHFIIGYDGEIIQCIPLDEIGYAVMGRNYDSISIECCYLQEDGKFTEKTYDSLIRLCAWLLDEYNLTPQDMRRHYDEGGKKCPLYFTEHVEAWEQFKRDLEQYIAEQENL